MRVQLYAERCSGSNFVRALLERNVAGIEVSEEGKHFYPTDEQIRRADAVLVVYRDPFQWAASFHRSPWGAAPSLKGKPFSEFIRSEWVCVRNEDLGFSPGDPGYGEEMMDERDPETGRRHRNVLRLRSSKIRAWEALEGRVPAFLRLRFEDASREPRRFVEEFARRFGLETAGRFRPVWERKGVSNRWRRLLRVASLGAYRFRPRRYRIADEDRRYILSQLELPLERRIGYLGGEAER